jgi:hypothetical protein
MHIAVAFAQVASMRQAHPLQVSAQRFAELLRQHRHTIQLSLAISYQDLAVGKVNVFDPQPEAFHGAQTRAVQKTCDQPARSGHLRSRRATSRFRGREGRF